MVGGRGEGREGERARGSRVDRPWLWALILVGGVALIFFVLWIGPWLFTRHPSSDLSDAEALKAENDVRTTLVQAVAGLAVAGGAIVTYRTFRHTRIEHDRAYVTGTYTTAVEQLGHEQAPVRLGALYSLVRLAQDNPSRRQTVVDVLCAYLRMPFTPPMQPERAAEAGSAASQALPADAGVKEREVAQELQVRQTAQRLLADHLEVPGGVTGQEAQGIDASPDLAFWPDISIDLTGATLVDLDLSDSSVAEALFDRATFCGEAWFSNVTFGTSAFFREATFTDDAWFPDATFINSAHFSKAAFTGEALFPGATFSVAPTIRWRGDDVTYNAEFDEATFTGRAVFRRAIFHSDAKFDGATFVGDARFDGATFGRRTGLDGTHVMDADNRDLVRLWPDGWIVRPDADDPTRGTLVREQ